MATEQLMATFLCHLGYSVNVDITKSAKTKHLLLRHIFSLPSTNAQDTGKLAANGKKETLSCMLSAQFAIIGAPVVDTSDQAATIVEQEKESSKRTLLRHMI